MKLLFTLVLLHITLLATVDIAPVEIGANKGLNHILAASLSTNRGNTDKDQYSATIKSTYDNAKTYVFWAEGSFKYGQANAQLNEQKAYIHARYIHGITSKALCFELFSQVESDRFKDINNKILNGGGVRWNFFKTKSGYGKGYLGFGTYNEYITYIDNDINPDENNWRLNSYLAYSKKLGSDSKFNFNIYYQPRARFIDDFIFSSLMELQLHVYLELFLSFKVEYDYDSKPPIGVKKEDFYQLTSFIYHF